jgi:hypothetical protein
VLKKISSIVLAIILLLATHSSALAWRFVVAGDTRSDHTTHAEVMEGVIKKVPNGERVTLINTGDVTSNASLSNWNTWQKIVDGNYASFQTPGGLGIDTSKKNPPDYIGAVGNHDTGDSNWVTNWRNFLPAQRNVTAYSDIPGHADGLYGSYIYDNTLLLWVASAGRPSGQETYMENILIRANSDSRVVWKFVFFHHPPIPCGSKSDWSLGKTWHDNYFVPNDVDMVFLGHAHYYIRTCPFTSASSKTCDSTNRGNVIGDSNGVIHVVAGGGGAGLYSVSCTSSCSSCPWLEVGAKRYHFAEISIQGGQMNMKVWDPTSSATNPTLLDELTINKGPVTTPTPGTGRAGDGNNDGLVDGRDFIIWLSHYGQNVSGPSNGDYDNNGQVRISDYIVWVNNYTD